MGKRSKSRQVGVAAGLLWVAFAVSSCLLPQNDDPLPVIPPQKNRAPRILREQVKPPPPELITIEVGASGSVCQLPAVTAQVEDPDVGDRIRIRWTVYDSDGIRARSQVPDPRAETAKATPSFLTAPVDLFMPGAPLLVTNQGTQFLELIVADGEFSVDMAGNLTTLPKDTFTGPDGGTINNDTYLDSYTWGVESVRTTCP